MAAIVRAGHPEASGERPGSAACPLSPQGCGPILPPGPAPESSPCSASRSSVSSGARRYATGGRPGDSAGGPAPGAQDLVDRGPYLVARLAAGKAGHEQLVVDGVLVAD